jgi:hypothetical protein
MHDENEPGQVADLSLGISPDEVEADLEAPDNDDELGELEEADPDDE